MTVRQPQDELAVWLEALMAHGCNPKRSGDQWQALCPSHDDMEPSLTLTRGDKRPVVTNCFAGCTFEEIRDTLGIDASGPATTNTTARPKTQQPRSKSSANPKRRKTLPSGGNIRATYRYWDELGECIVFAVQRIEEEGDDGKLHKRFWQWTPDPDGWIPKGPKGNRPLWRLPEIIASDDNVLVVEGEKCVEAVLRAWPDRAVTTWAGGTQVWRKTNWSSIAGRTVTVVADGDWDKKKQVSHGHIAATQIADHLVNDHGCEVWLALPPTDGTDIADWLAKSKRYAADVVTKHRVRHVPKSAMGLRAVIDNTDESGDRDDHGTLDLLTDNEHYRLLGMREGRCVVWMMHENRVAEYHPKELFTPDGLRVLAANEMFWSAYTREGFLTKIDASQIGTGLVTHCRNQGIVDPHKFIGRGAARLEDGTVVYHLGDRMLVAGVVKPLGEMADRRWLGGPAIPLGRVATNDEVRAFAETVMDYRFASMDHARRLLGWMVAAIVGGALEWRPHVSIVAPASSGKSYLLDHVVAPVLGPLMVKVADTTAAALARMTQNESLPIVIDEAEPTKSAMMSVIEHLRIASGGDGLRLRADPAGAGVQAMTARYSALLSATKLPVLSVADESRLSPIRFGPEVDDWPALMARLEANEANGAAVGAYFIHQAQLIVDGAETMAKAFKAEGMASREADMSGALTSGWWAWGVDEEFVYSGTGVDVQRDSNDAVGEIMSVTVPTGGGTHASLLAMVCNPANGSMIADLYGVKRDGANRTGRGLFIAFNHHGLKKALRRSALENVDLKSLLLQVPGATEPDHSQRFATRKLRAIHLPDASLVALGIDIVDPKPPSEPSQRSF